jgi:hypothetical protein
MEDVKLPDLSEIREGRKRNKELPPQTSAQDTSNWEGRTFSAPNLDTERRFDFSLPAVDPLDVIANPLLEQEKIKSEIRNKKKAKH